jgi:hypothetical protein
MFDVAAMREGEGEVSSLIEWKVKKDSDGSPKEGWKQPPETACQARKTSSWLSPTQGLTECHGQSSLNRNIPTKANLTHSHPVNFVFNSPSTVFNIPAFFNLQVADVNERIFSELPHCDSKVNSGKNPPTAS